MSSLALSALPAIPQPSDALALDRIKQLSEDIIEWSESADLAMAIEILDRTMALETYYKKRGMAGPMQTADRHLERRIGELLGEPKRGRPTADNPARAQDLEERRRYIYENGAWSESLGQLPTKVAVTKCPLCGNVSFRWGPAGPPQRQCHGPIGQCCDFIFTPTTAT